MAEKKTNPPMMTPDGYEIEEGMTLYRPDADSKKPHVEPFLVIQVDNGRRAIRIRANHGCEMRLRQDDQCGIARQGLYADFGTAQQKLNEKALDELQRKRNWAERREKDLASAKKELTDYQRRLKQAATAKNPPRVRKAKKKAAN